MDPIPKILLKTEQSGITKIIGIVKEEVIRYFPDGAIGATVLAFYGTQDSPQREARIYYFLNFPEIPDFIPKGINPFFTDTFEYYRQLFLEEKVNIYDIIKSLIWCKTIPASLLEELGNSCKKKVLDMKGEDD